MKVRDKLPKRRSHPTNNPTGNNWSDHKPDLREDFNKHCGYCGSYDHYSQTWFEVDHFVPKSLFVKTGKIGLCQYDNLVYSCKFCNNVKSSKWPSNDEAISNINNKGFIDPCNVDFDTQVYRTNNGSIRWLTPLGKWMVEVGFKFDERDYAVKLLWELNNLRKSIENMMAIARSHHVDSNEHKAIKAKAGEFALVHFLYRNELDEYYKTM